MNKIARFNILTFAMIVVISAIGMGLYALSLKKAEEASVKPLPAQTYVAPTNDPTPEPSIEQSITSTPTVEPTDEEDYDYSDIDLSNYKPHVLPKDIDKWSDEEWAWWTEAASNFRDDYSVKFEDNFGDIPSDDVLEVAQNFAEEVCSVLDDGGTVDDIAAGIVDSGDNKRTQMALAMAVHSGVNNFCPWNKKKLN